MKREKPILALLLAALLCLGSVSPVLALEEGEASALPSASALSEQSEEESEQSEEESEQSEEESEQSEEESEEPEDQPEQPEEESEQPENQPEEPENQPEQSEEEPEEHEPAPEGSQSQPEQDPGLSSQEEEVQSPQTDAQADESGDESEEDPADPSTDPNYYTPTVELLTGEENAYLNYKALRKAIKRADGIHPLTITVARKGRYYISFKEGRSSRGMRLRTMTTLDLNGATLVRTGNISNLIQVENLKEEQSVTGYTCAKNLTIRNGTLDGGEGEAASVGVNLVNLGHVDGLRMENLTLTRGQGTHLVELNGCRNVTITDCTFTGFEPWMDEYAAARPEAIQLDIAYNGAKTPWNGVYCAQGTPGMDMTVCRNITITRCRFQNYPSGVGNHHALYDGPKSTGIKIINNTFENSKSWAYPGYAVWCYGFRDCEVSGNKIIGKYAVGVRLCACQAKVKDNQIGTAAKPFSGRAIYAHVANCNVVGELTKRKPVYVTKTSIYQNRIYTSFSKKKEGAITLLGKSALTSIHSNTISAPKTCGIAVRGGSSVKKLNSNHVTKAGRSAVYFSGAKVTNLERNTLSGSTGVELRSKSSAVNVRKNTISARGGVGIGVVSGSKVTRLTYNQVKKASKSALSVTGGNVKTLEKNHLTSSGSSGTLTVGKGGKVANLRKNSVKATKGAGIRVTGSVSVLESNSLTSSGTSGALVVGKGGKVTNLRKNSVKAAKGPGINISSGKVSVLTGNRIEKPAGDGIRLNACSVTKVDGNRVTRAKKNGILATDSAVVQRVTGNSVTNCKGTGIRLLNPKLKVTVKKNYLKGNGRPMVIPALNIPAPAETEEKTKI